MPDAVQPGTIRKGEAPADADNFKGEEDKFTKYFQDKPALRP
jgi:ferredoxin